MSSNITELENETKLHSSSSFNFPSKQCRPEIHTHPNSDSATKKPEGTVVLVHAMYTSSNYFTRPPGKSLVDFFQNKNLSVLRLDLSGYSSRGIPDRNICFETYVQDIQIGIRRARELNANSPVYILGHSVGGLAALVAGCLEKADAVVAVAPAIWTFHSKKSPQILISQYFKFGVALSLTQIFGRLPARFLKLGDRDAPMGYLKEYASWIRKRKFTSLDDQINYEEILKSSAVPTLFLEGARDKSMAPSTCVSWLEERLSPNSQKFVVSKKSGFPFDADHFSLIYGKNASESVWNRILIWMRSAKKVEV